VGAGGEPFDWQRISTNVTLTPTTRFAYQLDVSGGSEIWIQDAEGDGTPVGAPWTATIVRSGGWINRQPALSHDAQRLAFNAFSPSNTSARGIYLLDLSCPEPGCMAQQILGSGAFSSEFSPDDTKLLYFNTSDRGIYIYDFNNPPTLAYRNSQTDTASETWSNSGNNITFTQAGSMFSIPANCNNSCLPTPVTPLASSPRGYWQSANVTYLNTNTREVSEILYDGSRTGRTIIGGNGIQIPVWSPNGLWISYNEIVGSFIELRRVNSDCPMSGCNIKTLQTFPNGYPFDWQRIGTAALPDLVLTDIKLNEPPLLRIGDIANVTAEFCNLGGGTVDTFWEIDDLHQGIGYGNIVPIPLSSGQCAQRSSEFPLTTPASSYKFEAIVDPFDQVTESNENNNSMENIKDGNTFTV